MTRSSEPEHAIAPYLAALASANPTPGGGSAAALVGAFAAALGEMVCNLTTGRTGSNTVETAVRSSLARATALRRRLLALAQEDEVAYGRYATAAALPKGSDEDRAVRRAAMENALREAANVPLATARACLDLLSVLEPITDHGNKHVLSDANAAAILADAALRSALVNVRVNTRLMRDRDVAERLDQQATSIEIGATAAAAALSDASAARNAK